MLRSVIAFPESRRILWLHLFASPFLALQWGAMAMIPVLLRDHFNASAWQTTAATAAASLMFVLSVVWGEIYRRLGSDRYIALVWLVTAGPLAAMATAHSAWAMLGWLFLTSVGLAGFNPLNGDVLRSCYPPTARSKVFALTQMVAQTTVMASAWAIGLWLDYDNRSFRIYMPLAALAVAAGLVFIHRITRERLFQERLRHQNTAPFTVGIRNLVDYALDVLRKDADFRRYEVAYFVQGLGWIMCACVVPLLVCDVLALTYTQIAKATQSTFQLALIATMLPLSYLMDRRGPFGVAVWGFLMVMVYPVALMLIGMGWAGTHTVTALTLTTVWFGAGIASIHLAWTIGPVTLAPSASDASYYLAIHASMVAPRSLIGLLLVVGMYRATGSLNLPLITAAVFSGIGALLMWRLQRLRSRPLRTTVAEQIIPTPPRAT